MNEYQITEAVKTEAVVRLAEMYPIDSNHRAPIVESGWTVLAILEKAASEPCHRAEYGWQGDCANIQDSGPDMHYACGRCIARAFLKELAGQAEMDAEQNIDELDAEQIERIEIEDGRRCGECGSTEMGHCVYCKMD